MTTQETPSHLFSTLPLSLQPSSFLHLPFAQQLAQLEEAYTHHPPRPLLHLCACSRDHEPLIFLLDRLFTTSWLHDPAEQSWFAGFLLQQPDSAILQTSLFFEDFLQQSTKTSETSNHQSLAAILLQLVERAPLARLQAFGLFDKQLQRNFPQQHQGFLEKLQATCQAHLDQGSIEQLEIADLFKLPAQRLASLQAKPQEQPLLQARLQELAHDAIEILAAVPKPISQARAEELLSKRVYDDPGHFLFELLQNAEDQQSHRWSLYFREDQILIWHDGLPFDTRDLVGVTSIGQSNKKRHQIGFFGVGFKSVYEVTKRPQIYSGPYQFEIADVSMPRALQQRPEHLPSQIPATGTLLILPLREQDLEARHPARLYQRTHDLDPVILLTLRHLEQIDVTLDPSLHAQLPAGISPQQSMQLQGDRQQTQVAIHVGAPEHTQHYLLASAEIDVQAGLRSAEKTSKTRLLLGMRCDDQGIPQPLPPQAPRLYSFLPTAEDPGFDFFLQAHFDVPVDRERISRESRWNQYLIQQVPQLFAQMAREIHQQSLLKIEALRAFLRLLPHPHQLQDALFGEMAALLPAAFADIPIFPDAKDEIRPSKALYHTSPRLASLFAEIPLPTQIFQDIDPTEEITPSTRWPVAPYIEEIERQQLQHLGVPVFDQAMLPDLLAIWLQDLPEGAEVPTHLQSLFEIANLRKLYQQLAALLSSQQAESTERYKALQEKLASLPLLLDKDGRLHRGKQKEIFLGSMPLREAWGSQRTFVAWELEQEIGDILERLGAKRLRFSDLYDDLKQAIGHAPLTPEEFAQRWPVDRKQLCETLASASDRERKRFASLSLFLAHDQKLHPIAQEIGEAHAFHLPQGPVYPPLYRLLSSKYPLLNEASEIPTHFVQLTLTAPHLIDLVTASPEIFQDKIFDLHEAIGLMHQDLSSAHMKRLYEAPLWQTAQGRLTTLVGPKAPPIAEDTELASFFPNEDFLHPQIAAQPHIQRGSLEKYDVLDLFGTFLHQGTQRTADPADEDLDGQAPPFQLAQPLPLEAIQAYFLQQAALVRMLPLEERAQAPLFLDQHGDICPALLLSRSPSATWRHLLQRLGERHYLALMPPQQEKLLQALDLEASMQKVDPPEILRQCLAQIQLFNIAERAQLLERIAEHAADLPLSILESARKTPMFEDQEGKTAPIGSWDKAPWREDIPTALIFRCSREDLRPLLEYAGFRLLHPTQEKLLAPFFQQLQLRDASLHDLFEILQSPSLRKHLLQIQHLPSVRDFLLQNKAALQAFYPPQQRSNRATGSPILEALPLFLNQRGVPTPLEEMTISPALDALWPQEIEVSALARHRVHSSEETALSAFEGWMVPATPKSCFHDLLEEIALPQRALAEQLPPLNDLDTLQQLHQALRTLAPFEEIATWPIWADRKLRLRKGPIRRQDGWDISWFEGLSLSHDLLAPQLEASLSTEEKSHFPTLTAPQILEAITQLNYSGQSVQEHRYFGDVAQREKLYRFLLEHWEFLKEDKQSDAKIRTSALFATQQGEFRNMYELAWDESADEAQQHRPEESLPSALLGKMERCVLEQPLSIQEQAKPRFERWFQAAEKRDLPTVRHLIQSLAHLWQHASSDQKRALFQAAPKQELSLPSLGGDWLRVSQALLPSEAEREQLLHLFDPAHFAEAPEHPAGQAFLQALGVATQPTSEQLEDALKGLRTVESYEAFAHYLQAHPTCLSNEILRREPWMLNNRLQPTQTKELFWFDERIQHLVPQAQGLFPAPFYEDILPPQLQKPLRFRTIKDLDLEDILPSLPDKTVLETELLQWLERGIKDKRFKAEEVREACHYRHLVLCQDGIARHPHEIFAFSPSPLFGDIRGYWPEGHHRYPHLCEALRIPTQINPSIVKAFLEDIGQQARKDQGQAILEQHPSLIEILPRCYAYLHEQQAKFHSNQPIYLAETSEIKEKSSKSKTDRYALLLDNAPGFFVCLRPTMLAPYRGLSFYTAVLGSDDIAQTTGQLLLAQGIPSFEASISLKISPKAGKDTTLRHEQELESLRSQLRALRAVLPRVQAQRGGSDKDWIFASQLEQLTQPNAIRVFQGLKVKATLKGVGKLDVPDLIAYDPQKKRLMLDESLLRSLQQTIPLLATNLTPLIHRDPKRQPLTDILELLLRCQTLEAMQSYLDQRHFPRVALQEKGKSKGKQGSSTALQEMSSTSIDAPEDDESPSNGLLRRLWTRIFSNKEETPKKRAQEAHPSAPKDSPSLQKAHTPPPSHNTSSKAQPPSKAEDAEKKRPSSPPQERDEAPSPQRNETAPQERPKAPPPTSTPLSDFFNRVFDPPSRSSSSENASPEDWNRPNNRIGSQLDFDPKRFAERGPNPEDIGLFHQPPILPQPYRYALQAFTGRFDNRSQQWVPATLQSPLATTSSTKVGSVILQGKLPPGSNQLPLPLHSKLSGPPIVTCDGASVSFKQQEDPSGAVVLQFKAPRTVDVRYHVDLFAPPSILPHESIQIHKDYMQPTMLRSDLPEAIQGFLTQLEGTSSTQEEKARRIEEMVRKRYRYDMYYAQKASVQEARSLLPLHPRTPQNHSIALLHAGKQGSILGAGVCHGLNILIAELLRQVGIPSAVATCWVFDEGYLSRPDHLIALALLPSAEGTTYLPLDGAVNAQGRVLHQASPPPPRKAPDLPKTSAPDMQRAALAAQIELYTRILERLRIPFPSSENEALDSTAQQRRLQELRQKLLDALGSKATLYRLLAIFDAGELQVDQLDKPLQWLLEHDLIRAEEQTSWRVRPFR
ncbi:MAG: hypothetical protein H6727_00895 [Myxococcales bacterium]|nr:hypothetical protein [Myxococcales bacterium]